MKRIITTLEKNISGIFKVSLFILSVILIVYLFPRQASFKYEFVQGRPWLDEDLIAPFDFAIQKSTDEIKKEESDVLSGFIPFFNYDSGIYDNVVEQSILEFNEKWEKFIDSHPDIPKNKAANENFIRDVLDSIFLKGVLYVDENYERLFETKAVRLIKGQVAEIKEISDFYTIRNAYNYINKRISEKKGIAGKLIKEILERRITHNVFYNEEFTVKSKQSALDNISHTRGMVQQGEKIVSKGELVNAEKFRILQSYQAEHNKQTGASTWNILLLLGQIILVSIPVIVLALFLNTFRKDIFADNRKVILILLIVCMMVFFTSLTLNYDINLLYIVPVCIVPILIRAFFDNRLALHVHIITIILIGFLVPRSFEFVFMQFIAGIIAILSLVSLRKRSQIFIAVGWIVLSYSAVYFGLNLIQGNTPKDLDLLVFARFGISGILTLFAYPMIFLLERLFGLNTDFSLLELSDINSPLLRELSLKAPGSFQHSLQVANLAEEAVFAIGGNSLLVRTGAMYHDIGKMEDPLYYTENQHSDYNPHDELSYEESAEIIIGHVLKGIEKARKYKLPEYIIDFMRTHHGTSTTKYFYSMEINDNPDREVSKKPFTYSGPRPFSRETAVLMMADAVEAASRSLKNPDENSIDELVESIIDGQVNDKQFETANITFRDISKIKEIFKRRLMNIFHVRISYPGLKN
jgi:cyclic-di-AMP phosphodiesterase PgpH